MSDSIRARFSDSLELVTHVPIPAGEPETPIVYVVTSDESAVGVTIKAVILDDGEIKSADIALEAVPEDPSDLSNLTAYKIIKGVNNVLFYNIDGWNDLSIVEAETAQSVTANVERTYYVASDLAAGTAYIAILEPAAGM